MSEKSVQFPRAVYISASGQEIKVGSRPNDPKADAPYDAACHNPRKAGGRLVCEDCPDVDVHFVRGGDSAGGDAIIAADGHFASNPGQADNHTAGCREKAEARSQRKQYDLSEGFRLHINTGYVPHHFDGGRGYRRNSKGGIKLRQAFSHLAVYEPRSLHNAEDFIDLFQPSERGIRRLTRSFVIARDLQPIPWEQFFMKHQTPYTGVKSLMRTNLDTKRNPALYIAKPYKIERKTRPNGREYLKVSCMPMHLGRDERRVSQVVHPQIFIDDPSIQTQVLSNGLEEFMVLSKPKVRIYDDGDRRESVYIDFSINEPREICFAPVREIIRERQSRLSKRTAMPA